MYRFLLLLLLILSYLLSFNLIALEYEPIVNEFKTLNGLQKDNGHCELNGRKYAYNSRVAMNRQLIEVYEVENDEVVPESLVVLMQCKYIVDATNTDHPELLKRKYIWVAGQ